MLPFGPAYPPPPYLIIKIIMMIIYLNAGSGWVRHPAHMRRDAEQSLVTVMRMTREQHYAASTRRMVCWILRMHNARRRDAVHGLVTVMRMTREQHDAASTRRMVCWIL
jgi:hypothetical protein